MAPKISKKSASASAAASTLIPEDQVPQIVIQEPEPSAIAAIAADDVDVETEDLSLAPGEIEEGSGPTALDAALAHASSVYQSQILHYQATIVSAKTGMALTKTVFKDLIRNIKLCNKKARKMNPRNKGPHGLSVQVGISPEMEEFLKVEPGTKMSRPEVGRAISEYCIANGLRGEEPSSGKKKDNRILRTDDVLRKLLSQVPDDKVLHYFNLQHYIKHHFVKAIVPVAAAVPLPSVEGTVV